MDSPYCGVLLGVTNAVTGAQVKLEVDMLLSAGGFNRGDILVVEKEKMVAKEPGAIIMLRNEPGRNTKIYVYTDVKWLRETVKTIKALAKEHDEK